jgi:hypothetical protein
MKKEVYSVNLKVAESLLDANHVGMSKLPLPARLVSLLQLDHILVPTGLSQVEFDELFQILQLKPVLQAEWTVGDSYVELHPPKPEASDQQH